MPHHSSKQASQFVSRNPNNQYALSLPTVLPPPIQQQGYQPQNQDQQYSQARLSQNHHQSSRFTQMQQHPPYNANYVNAIGYSQSPQMNSFHNMLPSNQQERETLEFSRPYFHDYTTQLQHSHFIPQQQTTQNPIILQQETDSFNRMQVYNEQRIHHNQQFYGASQPQMYSPETPQQPSQRYLFQQNYFQQQIPSNNNHGNSVRFSETQKKSNSQSNQRQQYETVRDEANSKHKNTLIDQVQKSDSNSLKKQKPSEEDETGKTDKPSPVLYVIIFELKDHQLVNDDIHTLFSPFGFVNKVLIFKKASDQTQVFVEMASTNAAEQARETLFKAKIQLFPHIPKLFKLIVHYSLTQELNLCNYKTEGQDYRNSLPSTQPSVTGLPSGSRSGQKKINSQFRSSSSNYQFSSSSSLIEKSNQTTTLCSLTSIPTQNALNELEESDLNSGQNLQTTPQQQHNNTSRSDFDNNAQSSPIQSSTSLIASSFGATQSQLNRNNTQPASSSFFQSEIQFPAQIQLQEQKEGTSSEHIPHHISTSNHVLIENLTTTQCTEKTIESEVSLSGQLSTISLESSPQYYVIQITCGCLRLAEFRPENIYNIFRNFGFVHSVLFLKDENICFVQYEEINQAKMAINQLNNLYFFPEMPFEISFSKHKEISIPSQLSQNPNQTSSFYFLNKNNDPRSRIQAGQSLTSLPKKGSFYNPASRTVYVANIPIQLSQRSSEFLALFQRFGYTTNFLINAREIKISALIEFDTISSAVKAISFLHNSTHYGKILQVFFTRSTITR